MITAKKDEHTILLEKILEDQESMTKVMNRTHYIFLCTILVVAIVGLVYIIQMNNQYERADQLLLIIANNTNHMNKIHPFDSDTIMSFTNFTLLYQISILLIGAVLIMLSVGFRAIVEKNVNRISNLSRLIAQNRLDVTPSLSLFTDALEPKHVKNEIHLVSMI